MIIRTAKLSDLPAIVRIYNQAIETKKSTGDLTKVDVNSRKKWLKEHDPDNYPVFVCEIGNDVCGWISLSPYRAGREALRYTSEVSYYVDFNSHGKGVGSKLLNYVIRESPKYHIKTIVAIVLERNVASINMLKKFNFEQWGYLPNVADFDSVECGHLYFGLRVDK